MTRPFCMILVSLALVSTAACAARNPEACCSTAVECEQIGFDEITPCLDLRVCVDGHCVAPTCTTSAECLAPTPYCVNQMCASTCAGNADCVGVPGLPFCAPDGACVECLDNTGCPDPLAMVCDEVAHACRACTDDIECDVGVCLAAEGACVAADDVVYVSMAGSDTGDCTSTAPCATTQYALQQLTAIRRVLRISSVSYQTANGITLDRDVYLDADGSRLQRSTTGPVLTVTNGATVVLEGVRVQSETSFPGILVNGAAVATANDIELDSASIQVTGMSRLRVQDSRFTLGGASCSSSSYLEVLRSAFESDSGPAVTTQSCSVAVSQTMFSNAGILINGFVGEPATIENNVFAHSSTGADILTISGNSAAVRFNTFASTTGNPNQFFPLFDCQGFPVEFSSNIAAVKTADPFNMGTTCVIDHSLFDTDTGQEPGEGNVTEPYASILVDLPGGDYRTAPTSAALGAGDPDDAVADDFTGAIRPQPAGTPPDSGAYELP